MPVCQSGGNRAYVSAVNRGRVDSRRIANAAEVEDILLITLEEDACAAPKRCFSIAKKVVSKAKAGAEIVPAEFLTTLRQAVRPFANHSVVRISGARDD